MLRSYSSGRGHSGGPLVRRVACTFVEQEVPIPNLVSATGLGFRAQGSPYTCVCTVPCNESWLPCSLILPRRVGKT